MIGTEALRKALRTFGCALTVAGAMGVQAPYALADASVAGVDHYFVSAGDATADEVVDKTEKAPSVDVARVTGEVGDTVYVELRKNGLIQASHLPFTLAEETAEAEGESMVGVLSIANFNYDPTAEYTLKVFSDRSQKTCIYDGTIEPVYATYDGHESIIAVRTIADKETRAFVAPSTITEGNALYARVSDKVKSEDPITYEYALADGVEAPIKLTYIDDEGKVLLEEKLGTLAAGNTQTIEVPQLIKVEGEDGSIAFYRTVSFNDTLTATFPGTSEFTVSCKALSAASDGTTDPQNYYVATINLVNEEGAKLATDTLDVTSPYLYTPPTKLHITAANGGIDTYVLADENENLNSSKVLALNPATDNVTEGKKTYNINYTKLADDAELTWTIKLVNGKADPKADDRVIDTVTKTVKPGETVTFEPEQKMTIDGIDYVPVTSTKDSYSYTYGEIPAANEESVYPTLTVYYVPDGWTANEPYDIEVRYVNIANKEVIKTSQMTVRPEDRDNLEITSEESFIGDDGIEYVRLAGQERSIFHSYYSSARVYTIYYRDINDDLNAETVITNIEVEYEDGGETVTDGGTTTIDDGTNYTDGETTTTDGGTTITDNGTTTTDNGTTTTDNGTTTTDGGTTYVDGGTNTTTTYRDGGTTNTETIGGTTTNVGATNAGTANLGTTDLGTANLGTTDLGTTDLGAGDLGAADAGAGAQNATRAQIPAGENLTVVNGQGNSLVTDSAGRDTNTMRIEDNATPLAGPGAQTAGAEEAVSVAKPNAIGIAAAATVATLGLLFFVFYKRRREEEKEAAETTETTEE